MNEKLLLKQYEEYYKRWMSNFDKIINKPITSSYFESITRALILEKEGLTMMYQDTSNLSVETHEKINTIEREIFLNFVFTRAMCVSLWLDKHGNILDKFIGNRNISLPYNLTLGDKK